jgi:hypothetical protein
MLLIALSPLLLKAQEKKNEITISGIAAHYDGMYKYTRTKSLDGFYLPSIDPGIEISYSRICNDFFITTGLNLQQSWVASYTDSFLRFISKELAVPVKVTVRSKRNDKSGLLLTSGLYVGKLIRVKVENQGKTETWHEIPKSFLLDIYSDDNLFADIYFSTGFYQSFKKIGKLSLTPFVKYRINTTWLNYYEKKIHYGVKLSYSLDF